MSQEQQPSVPWITQHFHSAVISRRSGYDEVIRVHLAALCFAVRPILDTRESLPSEEGRAAAAAAAAGVIMPVFQTLA